MATYNGQFQDASANLLLGTPHSYAPVETGTEASQAYTKGQMLVYNNRLCTVTAAIAANNTLTIGTNIAYKNVGDIGKQLVATDGTGFYFDVKDGKYGYYPTASRTASQFVPFGGAGFSTATLNKTVTIPAGQSVSSQNVSVPSGCGFAYLSGNPGTNYFMTFADGEKVWNLNDALLSASNSKFTGTAQYGTTNYDLIVYVLE